MMGWCPPTRMRRENARAPREHHDTGPTNCKAPSSALLPPVRPACGPSGLASSMRSREVRDKWTASVYGRGATALMFPTRPSATDGGAAGVDENVRALDPRCLRIA
jgi:hypothetical protein